MDMGELQEARNDPWEFFSRHDIKDIKRKYHPDVTREDTTDIFAQFQNLYRESQKPPEKCGKYEILREIGVGDLRKVYKTRCGKILKRPRIKSKSADNLSKREMSILAEIQKDAHFGKYTNKVEDSFVQDGLNTVMSYPEELYSFNKFNNLDGVHIAWITKRMLIILGYLHHLGYGHCAVTPEHVLLGPKSHAGVLTGFIHTKKLGEPIEVVPLLRKDWYTSKVASKQLDLVMLSRTMLAGNLPKRLVNFMRGMAMSNDAWECEEEFSSLLKEVYGPPKFHDLVVC